nr:unnamed protein product [Callosobruchus analis]
MDAWGTLDIGAATLVRDDLGSSFRRSKKLTIEKLPDKVLLHIFSYLTHKEICRMARVCKRWRLVAYDTRLWKNVSLRPEISGLHAFPTKLKYLCICLSEVIFMEGFMRKIYNFINGLEILHLIGTYEKVEEEEEEVYEVVNVHKLKSATPNLRVINLYGINFVDDSHIDAFSSNCIQLECLAVNYCSKVVGSTMKTLLQRSRRLKCLLMNGTSLQSEYLLQVEWEKCSLQELDVTATDLSTECLQDMLTRLPGLRFLSAGQINGFNDSVLKAWMESGNPRNLVALDLDSSDNLSEEAIYKFLCKYGINYGV